MLNSRIAAIVSLTAAALLHAPAHAYSRDFQLTNSTPWTMTNVYVAAPDSEVWNSDVLGTKVIASGNSVNVYWPNSGSVARDQCNYDVMVKFSGNARMRWNNVDTCSIRQMNVWYDFQRQVYQASWN